MTEYWERSQVTGYRDVGERRTKTDMDILHRRGEDPIVLACRRSLAMAGSDEFFVDTEEAFQVERHGLPVHRGRREIPKEEKPQWTYGDLPD